MVFLDRTIPVYFVLISVWIIIIKSINSYYKKYNFKITTNLNSFFHAINVIFLYLIGINPIIVHYWSCAYYLLDLIMTLKEFKITIYDSGILLHHFVTLYTLNYLCYLETYQYMFNGFFISELSNIPMYIVYHLKSTDYQNTIIINCIIIIETMGFIGLRLLYGGQILIIISFIDRMPLLMCVSAWIIFMISFYWSCKLVNQIYKFSSIYKITQTKIIQRIVKKQNLVKMIS